MLKLRPAKSIQGNFSLPVSPDLLFMAALSACAAKRKIRIFGVKESEVINDIRRSIQGHASFELTEDILCISPESDSDPALLLTLPSRLLPYRMIYLFTGLGMGKTVTMAGASQKQLNDFTVQAKRLGIKLEMVSLDELTGLKVKEWSDDSFKKGMVEEEDCAALLSFLLGKRERRSFTINFHLSTPLRQLAQAFGFAINVKSEKNDDPVAQRIKFLQNKKRAGSAQNQISTVQVDFVNSTKADDVLDINIPGDEILAAALISAKCLVPKGNLILSNVALELWASQAISFIRKMGGKFSIQENGKSAFGVRGTVELQKSENSGKKIRCSPLYQFIGQLPSMTIAAAFAKEKEKSVFRNLDGLRAFEPDGIDQLEKCLRPLGVRHGEMPDGIVVEGAREFDGFELTDPLPAHIAVAFCMAGFRCLGETAVPDDSILARWPDFREMINEICEFFNNDHKNA
ncbi:MAG: hypothetical protein LBI42_00860 [Chitinispirillales bacterium]|jgi:5-enolpyruvylshikimate-3-phosphate synthase|nr:hypothetical protein [Chitinispirillales bacterium]